MEFYFRLSNLRCLWWPGPSTSTMSNANCVTTAAYKQSVSCFECRQYANYGRQSRRRQRMGTAQLFSASSTYSNGIRYPQIPQCGRNPSQIRLDQHANMHQIPHPYFGLERDTTWQQSQLIGYLQRPTSYIPLCVDRGRKRIAISQNGAKHLEDFSEDTDIEC